MADDDCVLVCLRAGMPSDFSDNLTGTCSECGADLFYRPHAAKLTPRLVCHVCFARNHQGVEHVYATKETVQEFLLSRADRSTAH